MKLYSLLDVALQSVQHRDEAVMSDGCSYNRNNHIRSTSVVPGYGISELSAFLDFR